MEFLDNLADWFNAFTGWAERFITKLFGSSNVRQVEKIGFVRDKEGNSSITPDSVLDRINRFEPEMEAKSDAELKAMTCIYRERLKKGETLDDLLPEAFAAVRESSKRALKMRHYDVQMVGGYILHHGMIAEMVTGEGKTLVATLPVFLNALSGPVHVITVNDYLAVRDMEWMGPVYMNLGLTVGAIESNMDPEDRIAAYRCDITYGTNNEFGFDYLRDNMKPTRDRQCQHNLNFAVVDEIDNILIDEARTPLIISGSAHDDITKYSKANRVAKQLKRDEHFEVKEKEHTCHLTDVGVRKAEELAGVESFYTVGNMEWPHLIDNSLKAHYLYKKDVNYVIENREIIIVDEFTGRKMEGRQWSDGLHQAVEAKEGVPVKEESQTLATITLQNYFKLYKKLCGMTGTAMTEASEFWKIYKLDVISVPTNMPLRRVNATDVIFRHEREKWDAVVGEIRDVHKTGRPILVGTVSIEKSELLSDKLNKFGVKHKVLNAKYHEREAEIIAQAGRHNAVTISTNMAGRGTDIILGGNPEHMAWDELSREYESRLDVPKLVWDERIDQVAEREGMTSEGRKVAELGGLHVIGSERHDSRRIDLQLRGRAGRQGDPGSSRFFLSLEDDLMRLFAGEWVKNMLTRLGMKDGEAIESRMVMKRVEGAQKKREEMHFDQRKNLLEYDEVMDDQRKRVYDYRNRILDGTNCRELILEMIDQQVETGVARFVDPLYRWETISAWAAQEFRVEFDSQSIRGMERDSLEGFLRDESIRQAEDNLQEQLQVDLPEDAADENEWNWLALSKWANAKWNLSTNDRELKKVGRDELFRYLKEKAVNAIDRNDYSLLDELLADDMPDRALCGWLNAQFTLEVSPEEFQGMEFEETVEIIKAKIREMYREKEVLFPVAVGMTRFMADRQSSGDKFNREGLLIWVNDRFHTSLGMDDLKNKSKHEVESLLSTHSKDFLASIDQLDLLEDYLEDSFKQSDDENGSGNGRLNGESFEFHATEEQVAEVISWVNSKFQTELDPSEIEQSTLQNIRQSVLMAIEERYRPELKQAEKSLILEILDTAWKEHLHYMDQLRSWIGLAGYAQKDPKTEYKREGRKAFNDMWDRVNSQVTSSIFRLEKESPEFVGSLWEITSTVHEEATNVPMEELGQEPGSTQDAVETIRNRGPKVGRNDPCPCGSGKKYKKCHG